jgi:sulfate adenylyltransferase
LSPVPSGLVDPYGGALVDLLARGDERIEALEIAERAQRLVLSETEICDLELLACGGFSPLRGFLGREDYRSVVETMRLADGTLWPLPVTLSAPESFELPRDGAVALSDAKGVLLALLRIEEEYEADLEAEKEHLFARSEEHPTLRRLRGRTRRRIAGPLTVLQAPVHHDFPALRLTPDKVRRKFADLGWRDVVAFQTRNPIHRAHEELVRRSLEDGVDGCLIHPVAGFTRPGDLDAFTRVRCIQAVLRHFDPRRVALALLPLAMRMAGPREALLHAVVRRNYGCTRLIVGRDHAGPGSDSTGRPFYGPLEAQDLLRRHEDEIGVKVVPFRTFVYVPSLRDHLPADEVPEGVPVAEISGTQVRAEYLARGRTLPEWFTRPEVAALLAEGHPPRHRQGVTVWLTGLSQAGKSTIAEILAQRLLEHGRASTVLDGDVVRTHLSKGLGFSREAREASARRTPVVSISHYLQQTLGREPVGCWEGCLCFPAPRERHSLSWSSLLPTTDWVWRSMVLATSTGMTTRTSRRANPGERFRTPAG